MSLVKRCPKQWRHFFYVDDCLESVSDEDTAITLCTELGACWQKVDFDWQNGQVTAGSCSTQSQRRREHKDFKILTWMRKTCRWRQHWAFSGVLNQNRSGSRSTSRIDHIREVCFPWSVQALTRWGSRSSSTSCKKYPAGLVWTAMFARNISHNSKCDSDGLHLEESLCWWSGSDCSDFTVHDVYYKRELIEHQA